MKFNIKNYDFENIVDEGKRFVIEELARQLRKYPKEICVCADCVMDMAALALNTLPPRYKCSLLGGIYQADCMNDPEYAGRVKHAVSVAIERVSSNPSHD
ncbi:MAG: late competence development ComFB family protein [Spirochaetaceae bacterium]|jgi:competence protein ComFB|nr:late competence development ComFB family protein [Spirochaetaceae bacterium]